MGVDVHGDAGVFVAGEVLDGFDIDTGQEEVGDVGVAQDVGGNGEVDGGPSMRDT